MVEVRNRVYWCYELERKSAISDSPTSAVRLTRQSRVHSQRRRKGVVVRTFLLVLPVVASLLSQPTLRVRRPRYAVDEPTEALTLTLSRRCSTCARSIFRSERMVMRRVASSLRASPDSYRSGGGARTDSRVLCVQGGLAGTAGSGGLATCADTFRLRTRIRMST
jgi:hypothetical protein